MTYNCPSKLKGCRLISLDIETTGLDIRLNNIIELGVVEVVDGVEKRQYSRLFGGGRSSPYLVRNVHGITDGERKNKSTFKESSQKISDYLFGATLVTHNGAKFDIPFMEWKMKEAGVSLSYKRHFDTYLLAKSLKRPVMDEKGKPVMEKGKQVFEPIHERHSLEYLCGVYGIPYNEENHRGLKDCWCTLQLLYALTEKFPEVIA